MAMTDTPLATTRVLFSDLHGNSHGKYVDSAKLDRPTHYAITVLTQGLNLDMVEALGFGADVGYPDMEGRVDMRTRRPGWESGIDIALADLWRTDNHQPVALDPRWALSRQVDGWRARGLEPLAGFEMEFFVLAEPSDGMSRLKPLSVPSHRVYAAGPGCDPSGLALEIYQRCRRAGIAVDGYNGEFHPGQVEVATGYRAAMDAADDAFLFRELAHEVALERGMGVTFMARPFADFVGNGMHLNISMGGTDGTNQFHAPDEPHGLSAVCRHSIAGLLAHHEALTAIGAPTVNSYKRLRPGMLSGYWANWGIDNRISTVRVPGERGRATRVEHRMADGTASPHLVLAALLAAMADGVEQSMTLPEPQVGDGDAAPNTERHAPHDLPSALDALEQDQVLVEALGEDLVACLVKIKRAECARWAAAVTDWEHQEYGRFF
jgi:glutamine synthetase